MNDSTLDFYNEVKKVSEELTEDEALLVISHNHKEGHSVQALAGDWQTISALLSTNGYVNLDTPEQEEVYENIKRLFLNTALNICATDRKTRKRFMRGLKQIDKKTN